jgi:hypothetical protein
MSEYKGDGGGFDDNYKLPPFWPWVFLLLALMLAPFLVFADTVTYASQTLSGTSTTVDGGNTDSYPLNDVYMITVTVSEPLAPNLNMAMITPIAWVVTCQNCLSPLSSSPTNAPAPPLVFMSATSAVFMFSTDATGKITNWSFAINGNSTTTDYGEFASQNNGSFSSSFSSGDAASSFDTPGISQYKQVNAGPAGLWTQSSLSSPSPAVTVLARTCNSTWATPNNNVPAGLTPNANGTGMNCRVPSQYPPSWYIKVTTDGGKTYEFVTLASLSLGN